MAKKFIDETDKLGYEIEAYVKPNNTLFIKIQHPNEEHFGSFVNLSKAEAEVFVNYLNEEIKKLN